MKYRIENRKDAIVLYSLEVDAPNAREAIARAGTYPPRAWTYEGVVGEYDSGVLEAHYPDGRSPVLDTALARKEYD